MGSISTIARCRDSILGALGVFDLVLFLGLAQCRHERKTGMVIVLLQWPVTARGWDQEHDIFIQLVDAM